MAVNIFQPVPFYAPDRIEKEIPQELYHGQSTPFFPKPPIDFACRGIIGMPLIFANGANFSKGDYDSTCGMSDGQMVMNTFSSTSAKIILRILWPGCQPFERAISIEEKAQGVARKINKAKLVFNIFKCVERFYMDHKRGENWRSQSELGLTPDRIALGELFLHQLIHVSKGSYQPVFCIRTAIEM